MFCKFRGGGNAPPGCAPGERCFISKCVYGTNWPESHLVIGAESLMPLNSQPLTSASQPVCREIVEPTVRLF